MTRKPERLMKLKKCNMTAVEIKKELVKKVVTPFFKNNGFLKSGVKYSQDLSFFKLKQIFRVSDITKRRTLKNFV